MYIRGSRKQFWSRIFPDLGEMACAKPKAIKKYEPRGVHWCAMLCNSAECSFYGGWGGTGGRVNCCLRLRRESITLLLAPHQSSPLFHTNHPDHLQDEEEE